MMNFLRAVTAHGTGAAAAQLNHPIGGKTGTTSDYTDAWFLGFSPSITCGVWVGYRQPRVAGRKRNRRQGRAAHLDDDHEAGHRRQRQ